jgi:hypothetical protein
LGNVIHETGHALGLGHDFRNDANFHGNVMGNGLRGMRGEFFPESYPEDATRISYAAALALSVNRYFASCAPGSSQSAGETPGTKPVTAPSMSSVASTPTDSPHFDRYDVVAGKIYGEETPAVPFASRPAPANRAILRSVDESRPTLTVSTVGTDSPVDGHVKIAFQAEDTGGLALALLRRNGDTVGEMTLSGTSVTGEFATPFYTTGEQNTFTVSAYDTSGNRTDAETLITPEAGFNHAPHPLFFMRPSHVIVGESVHLDASWATDPDNLGGDLLVQWDVDGDGLWDTEPSADRVLVISFSEAGNRLISLRATDSLGATSISTPIALRVSDQ